MLDKLIAFVRKNNRTLKILLSLFLVAFVSLVVYQVVEQWQNVDWSQFQIDYSAIALYFIAAFFGYLLFSKSWQMALMIVGERNTRFIDAFVVYMKSQLGAYIPGKVGLIITKVVGAQKKGISVKKATVASSLEIAIQMFSQFLIGIVAVFFLGSDLLNIDERFFYVGASALVIALLFFFYP